MRFFFLTFSMKKCNMQIKQMGYHKGSTRCDVHTRSGTSGSLICCSSFYFRDVQGLNGFNCRVCMSLQFSRLSRLLLPTNEGNSNPHFFLTQQTLCPCGLEFTFVLKCATSCCTPSVRLGETGRRAPCSRQPNKSSPLL